MIDRIANCKVRWKAILALTCVCLLAPSASADELPSNAEAVASASDAHHEGDAAHGDAALGDAALGDAALGDAALGGDAHGEEAGGHGDGHHETGVPISFKGDLALWSLVTFLAFLFVLKTFAWGPMIQGLDLREAGIRKAIEEAEENRRKSQAMLAEYNQKLKEAELTVQGMVAEAKRDAQRTSQDLIASAEKEVGAMRDRARDDINQARDTALAELFASMNSQVLSATEHVLGRAMNSEDQDRLVREALSGMSR